MSQRAKTRWKSIWPGSLLASAETVLFLAWSLGLGAQPVGPLLTVAAVRLAVRWRGGMYAAHTYRSFRVEAEQSLWTEFVAVGATLVAWSGLGGADAVARLFPTPALWPVWMLGWLVLSNAVVAYGRHKLAFLHRHWVNVLRVLVVGTGPDAKAFVRWLDRNPALGYRVVGVVRTTPCPHEDRFGYDIVADLGDPLDKVVTERKVDLAVLAVAHTDRARTIDALNLADGIRVVDGATLASMPTPKRKAQRKERADRSPAGSDGRDRV